MKKQYSEAQHSKAVAMYQAGIPVMDIAAQSGIPRSTLYSWIKSENDRDRKKSPTAKQLLDLERPTADWKE